LGKASSGPPQAEIRGNIATFVTRCSRHPYCTVTGAAYISFCGLNKNSLEGT